MKSIDNLREYVLTAASVNATTRAVLAGYADEIEHEVKDNERFRDEAEPFHNRLRETVDKREDVTLFGVDYTPLPVDADGVPIRAGDVLDGYGKTIEVVEMRYGRSGWVLISRDGNGYADCAAFTHHHAPTVEDVLREFAQEMNENLGMYTGEAIDADEWHEADERTIAEFAKRLRLAGGEDA